MALRLFSNTALASAALGFTHTATMSTSSPSHSALIVSSAMQSATPAATAACAAPQVISA